MSTSIYYSVSSHTPFKPAIKSQLDALAQEANALPYKFYESFSFSEPGKNSYTSDYTILGSNTPRQDEFVEQEAAAIVKVISSWRQKLPRLH